MAVAYLCAAMAVLGAARHMPGASPAAADAQQADSSRCELDPPADVQGLESCVQQSPGDVEALLELGDAYRGLRRREDSLRVYRDAVAADPEDADARVTLAEALLEFGDVEGARRAGQWVEGHRPHDPRVRGLIAAGARAAHP
jgi:cytochrome c-type biogenesis protein CcmH/NrfG